MRHQVQWTAPAPFWGSAPDLSEAGRTTLRRPAILRFATDAFMEEFHRTLETDPPKLRELEAEYENWRSPRSAAPVVAAPARTPSALERRLVRLRTVADRKLAATSGAATAVLEPPSSQAQTTGGGTSQAKPRRLKLYQPGHQRFYLIAAALVCRHVGLPDRAINAARQERASFVLRRVRSSTSASGAVTRQEYGFVPSSTGGSWAMLQNPDTELAPGEDTLRLFSVNFQDDSGKKRRVLAGLIPAGRRETYVGAPEKTAPSTPSSGAAALAVPADLLDPGVPPPPVDPRIVLLSADVIEPWKALVLRADKSTATIRDPKNAGEDTRDMQNEARDALQVASWYVLLDLARFLRSHVPEAWEALVSTPAQTPPQNVQAVVDAIKGATLPTEVVTNLTKPANRPDLTVRTTGYTIKMTLKDALVAVTATGLDQKLEDAADAFVGKESSANNPQWPTFLFPLADLAATSNQFLGVVPNVTLPASSQPLTEVRTALRKISVFRDLIAKAWPATPPPNAEVPELPLAAQPVLAPNEPAVFVLRCVFDRPECGPLDPPLVSAPSREFELAGFFDSDAPARPIRIALPVDTSPAGLRRHPKNTAFMVSDMLCGQINRAKGMGFIDLVRAVLPWPLHKDLSAGASRCTADGASLGMICSLSIPIITICALILLIIIVSLLDFIFRWLPYFIFCFPLPKFGAKPASES